MTACPPAALTRQSSESVAKAAAGAVDLLDRRAHPGGRGRQLGRLGRDDHDARSERRPARRGRVHDPPETATGGAAVGVGVDAGGAIALAESAGGTEAAAPWLAGACVEAVDAVCPWKDPAAITASAPDSPTAAPAIQRVTLEIRRSPALRASTAWPLAAGPASSSDINRIVRAEPQIQLSAA